MSRFDPRAHQPPPGYFLCVEAARALNFVTHDANLALVILIITASCGAVLLIDCLASEWFRARAARFAQCHIFVLSPGLVPWHGRGHRFDPDQVHQTFQQFRQGDCRKVTKSFVF
jgi:hypothetical protein